MTSIHQRPSSEGPTSPPALDGGIVENFIVAADHDMVHVAGGLSREGVGDARIVVFHEAEHLLQVCVLVAPCNDSQATP